MSDIFEQVANVSKYIVPGVTLRPLRARHGLSRNSVVAKLLGIRLQKITDVPTLYMLFRKWLSSNQAK